MEQKKSFFRQLLFVGDPTERAAVVVRLSILLWPVLCRLAGIYRRIVLRRTCVVAVVGSYGKTTTTRAIRCALGLSPGDQYPGNSSSYLAFNLLRLRPRDRFLVIETGVNRPGRMRRYAWMLKPDVAVITAIGTEHHLSFGTLEATRQEKAEIVRALSPRGKAILNADDPNVMWMAGETAACVTTCGTAEDSEIRACRFGLEWPVGSRFETRIRERVRKVRSRLIGEHQVFSILAAIAVAEELGIEEGEYLGRLSELDPTEGRLSRVRLPSGAILVRDDFKSSYETIQAAFQVFARIPAQRRILVLGDVSESPGPQGPVYRSLGRQFARFADEVFLFSHGAPKYYSGARSAGFDSSRMHRMKYDWKSTAEALRKLLKEGDVVLVKGRDTEKMDRVALALLGRDVRCRRKFCNFPWRCEGCSRLESPADR